MAKCRIMQTMPHGGPGTVCFLVPKISAKLKQGHPQWRHQMQVVYGKCRWGSWKLWTFEAKHCQLSSVASLSHRARLLWCSASRGFVSDSWSLLWLLDRQNDTHLATCFSRQANTRKVKPFWILMKQEMSGWHWHLLDHMQIICISFHRDDHASTSSLDFFYRSDARCSSWRSGGQCQSAEGKSYYDCWCFYSQSPYKITWTNRFYCRSLSTVLFNLFTVFEEYFMYDCMMHLLVRVRGISKSFQRGKKLALEGTRNYQNSRNEEIHCI